MKAGPNHGWFAEYRCKCWSKTFRDRTEIPESCVLHGDFIHRKIPDMSVEYVERKVEAEATRR